MIIYYARKEMDGLVRKEAKASTYNFRICMSEGITRLQITSISLT